MKHQKTESLRKLSPIFFQIGLLIALSTTLAAFKWTIYYDNVDAKVYRNTTEESTAMRAISIVDEHKKEMIKVAKEKKITPPNPDEINLTINKSNDTNVYDNKLLPDLGAIMAAKPKNPFGNPSAFKGDDEVVGYASTMPSYPGGYIARKKFIIKNMVIPYDVEMNIRQRITIYIGAIVEKDGRLSNIEVIKNGGYPSAGAAAKKVIEAMPKWNAGYKGIWPVRIRISIPIKIVK